MIMKKSIKPKLPETLPQINVGKKGLCENVVREIDRQLDDKEYVKIRFLRSALAVEGVDKRKLAAKLASMLNARIIDVRGLTVTLYRRRRIYKG